MIPPAKDQSVNPQILYRNWADMVACLETLAQKLANQIEQSSKLKIQ